MNKKLFYFEVVNQRFQSTPDGKLDSITGTAWVPNPDEPGQLKVSFFPLISSQYNIIALDEVDYSYAMVAGENYKFLWILSRTPQMDSETYDMFIQHELYNLNILKQNSIAETPINKKSQIGFENIST